MNIRRMRKEDIVKAVSIVNRNFDEVMTKVHSIEVLRGLKEENTIENWENQINLREIFVVEEQGEAIATGALANFENDTLHEYRISNFFVQPEYHGKGIGKKLFYAILEIAKERKIDSLHVPSSRSGIEFYRHLGFIEDEIQEDEAHEVIWMTRTVL
ncbi:MAG: GNAT family N-acetyltransferase [Bacillota bacterium]|nr:GNAT family N-acetyltransferase [Bacillota bacterium]